MAARVLVVEDNEVILRMVKDILEIKGYEVLTAGDGESGLRKFIDEKPDLLITDCLLPKMDGFKLVKNIRELESAGRTPIMMMSAIYRKNSYFEIAMETGADQYMTKPFEPDDLLRRVERLLGGIEEDSDRGVALSRARQA